MWLKRFRLIARNNVIRDVNFKKGLNLIIDSPTTSITDTGNSVGKTTFLRSVDYCLGSDGTNIYKDKEFGTPNEQVLKFLESDDVVFELILEGQLGEVAIQRPWTGIPEINGIPFDIQEFRSELSQRLFGLNVSHPSFRQLIGKFIRTEPHQISNTIKFVYHGTPDDYDLLYMHLFGFENPEILDERYKYITELSSLLTKRTALKSVSKKEILERIKLINNEISRLKSLIREFEVGPAVTEEIGKLTAIRKEISEISLIIDSFSTRRTMNLATKQDLENRQSQMSSDDVEALYEEARTSVEKLHRSFEEALNFHNSLLVQKIRFIDLQVHRDEELGSEHKSTLTKLLGSEKILLQRISDKGALTDYNKLHLQLAELFEKRGQQESVIIQLQEVESKIKSRKSDIEKTEESIISFESELKKRVTNFNLAFGEYSRQLYGVTYELTCDFKHGRTARNLHLAVKHIEGNEGSGKKRAQIVAFDLAYLKMTAEMNPRDIRFTLHDKVEEIHENQIQTLFEIANTIDGQYVVAVLRDKLKQLDASWIKDNTILELSQNDKFFGFPDAGSAKAGVA